MLAIAIALAAVPAADIFVDVSAPCAAGNGSQSDPYCTLHAAVSAAAPGDTIRVAPGTYAERLSLPRDVTIVGEEGAGATVIDGEGVGTVISLPAGVAAELSGLTITGGLGVVAGGIDSRGELTLRDSIVRGNSAVPSAPADQHALALKHVSDDRLVVERCLFEDNVTSGSFSFSPYAPVVLDGAGAALFEDCTFTRNGTAYGAGIMSRGPALLLRRCTIHDSGVFPVGLQAIPAVEVVSGSLRMVDSTLDGNVATGVFLRSGGPFEILGCTITNHTGSGVFASAVDAFQLTVRVENSIVYDPTGGDLVGDFVSSGHNFFSRIQSTGLTTMTVDPTDLFFDSVGAPGLLALADNGGPTPTRLPECGSLLIDSGVPTPLAPTDQRGVTRVAGRVDRGAAEADCAPVLGCPAVPNSTGAAGSLTYMGATAVGADGIELRATGLVPGVFGLFVVSRDAAFVANPGGSQGNLCLGGSIGRFALPNEIFVTNLAARAQLDVSWTALPQGNGRVAAQPGETWFFQAWHRDSVGGSQTSNFSAAIGVTAR